MVIIYFYLVSINDFQQNINKIKDQFNEKTVLVFHALIEQEIKNIDYFFLVTQSLNQKVQRRAFIFPNDQFRPFLSLGTDKKI